MQVYVWLIYYAVQQETNNIVEQLYSKKKTHKALKLYVYGEGVRSDKIDPRKFKIRSF